MDFVLRVDDRDRRLPPGEYVIGRALECDIIVDDGLVSRRHARLVVRKDDVSLEDLKSRHGVLLNDSRLLKGTSSPIKHRDVFKVGHTLLTLIAVPTAPSRPARKPPSKAKPRPKPKPKRSSDSIPSWRIPTGKGLSGVVARASLIELEEATRHAMQAARVSGDPAWLERIFVEFRRQMRVPSHSVLAEVRALCIRLKPDPGVLGEYIDAIRGLEKHVDDDDLVRLSQVEALHAELSGELCD